MIRNDLEKLISFKTITNNCKENKKSLSWIKKQVKKLPVYIEEFDSNGFTSLIITTQKTKKPIIWLAAHLDVAPAPDEMFSPFFKNGKLYGRGAYDMKFAIACYLKLLRELGEDLMKYNFGLVITTDEEVGGYNGTKLFLEKGFGAKVCFLPDVGQSWKFEKGAKASWQILIQSKGKSAHGSSPWQGKNAIEELIEFLHILKKEFPIEPCKIENHYHNSINIGKIQGGEVVNQVADFAEALVDIRWKPEIEKIHIEKRINDIKKKYKDITIKEINFRNGYKTELNSYYFSLFSNIAHKKFKIKISSVFSHGTSDACFFNNKQIPVILIQPKGGGHHTGKEWVDIKDLERYYLILREFIEIVARK